MNEEEMQLKAAAFDAVYAYLEAKQNESQHDADEFYAVKWLLKNPDKTLFDAPFDIAPFLSIGDDNWFVDDFTNDNEWKRFQSELNRMKEEE